MGENTKIEWTDATFNPIVGCTKVSDGCKFCYAKEMMDDRYHKVKWGPSGNRVRTSPANWEKPLQWDRAAKKAGERRRVFCASLADVFEDHPDWVEARRDLCVLIERTRNLDWLLLTKRPENVNKFIEKSTGRYAHAWLADCKHVWIGASVENQEAAERRLPHLLNVPSSVRFLSCEPLLGAVNLGLVNGVDGQINAPVGKIDFVIVGGESGTNARPMHPEWARSLRDQCVAASVPYFFKQWGEWVSVEGLSGQLKEGRVFEFGDGCSMMRLGKKATGRLLDGVEWSQFPK